jgi:hypothetical protein
MAKAAAGDASRNHRLRCPLKTAGLAARNAGNDRKSGEQPKVAYDASTDRALPITFVVG